LNSASVIYKEEMLLLYVQLFFVATTPLFALNSATSGNIVYKPPLVAQSGLA
jgi:hypothetical protein